MKGNEISDSRRGIPIKIMKGARNINQINNWIWKLKLMLVQFDAIYVLEVSNVHKSRGTVHSSESIFSVL